MGDHADDEIFAGLDEAWGSRRSYRPFRYRALKHEQRTNQVVFSNFARDGTNFKAGDRVVHKASGVAGLVVSTRGTQICWRPDTRIKPGGIWVDSAALRFDI